MAKIYTMIILSKIFENEVVNDGGNEHENHNEKCYNEQMWVLSVSHFSIPLLLNYRRPRYIFPNNTHIHQLSTLITIS